MKIPTSITLPPMFNTGKIVLLDEKDRAYIKNIGGENSSYLFTVRYGIDNKQEENMCQIRCHVISQIHVTSSRSIQDRCVTL